MGLLGIPTRPKKIMQDGGENDRHYRHRNYSNPDAVENLIRYVTRTRENEERLQDLISYGAAGSAYYLHPDDIIRQFQYVQNVYGIKRRGGRRMYHEVFNLYDCEFQELGYDREQLWLFGMECCHIYYQMGFQAVFGIHWEPDKHYHIHFAVNSISFVDGHKWHTSLPEIQQRGDLFNKILFERQKAYSGAYIPLYFFG